MITLAFFLFLLYLYFVLFFDAKKHPFGCFFWCLLDSVRCYFLVFADSPVLLDGGSSSGGGQICQNAEIPPSFRCRYLCIFCKRMHLQYIEAFLVSTLGLCPKPQPHLRRRRGRRLKPNHLTLWRSVCRLQGVKGKNARLRCP